MSQKRVMPYSRMGSNYVKLFAFIQGKQVVTVAEVVAEGLRIGMAEKAAKASATVVLSKTKEGYGNMSAGKGYYMERLKKQKAGDPLRMRLRWYKNGEKQPERPTRKIVVASEKVATEAKTAKPVATKKGNMVTA